MKAKLEVNGVDKSYPREICDLESLIVFVMTWIEPKEEFVFEVKIDGERFSEAYEHQAREIDLEEIENVEIGTETEEEMAGSFLNLAPDLMDELENAFAITAGMLRDTLREEAGYDMLARSLETLHALKSHLESVWNTLGNRGGSAEYGLLWGKFDGLADKILTSQEGKDAIAIASLLEEQIPQFIKEWKKIIEAEEDCSLDPDFQAMEGKPVEEMAARA